MLELLTKFKDENKLSWYRIAKDVGVSYQTLFNWTHGKFYPSPVYQKIILQYMKNYKKSIDTISKV